MGKMQISAMDWHTGLRARYGAKVVWLPLDAPFTVTSIHDLDKKSHQPALLDDVFCLHRGGPKRVTRTLDGRRAVHDVPLNSLTIMPRHRDAHWETEGPDDYVHLTLAPRALDELIVGECGKTRGQIAFRDVVGFKNPLLLALGNELARVAGSGGEGRLYIDTLFTAFSLALLRHASDIQGAPKLSGNDGRPWSGGMAGWRLRRIVEFLNENKTGDVGMDDLTQVSGLSRAHFFRTFRQATGSTPRQYLERLRVEDVRRAIERGDGLPVAAAAAGFESQETMARAFQRVLSVSPHQYRRWYG